MRAVLILGVAAALLAACATAPPPPAVTEYARTDCAAAPDLAKAIGLTPKKEQAEFVVGTPVDAQTPCLNTAQGKAPYVLYALPAELGDKTVTVGGVLEMARILSPSVALLDRDGKVTRSFGPSDYLYRGAVYSVVFRPRAGEAYVLVTVDPARVGQRYDSIAIGTQTTATAVGAVPVSWTVGVDNKLTRTFSYVGAVQVTVNDSEIPKKK